MAVIKFINVKIENLKKEIDYINDKLIYTKDCIKENVLENFNDIKIQRGFFMKNNVLDIFVNDLNGALPYMTLSERKKYIDYSNAIENYEDIIYNCFQDENDYLFKTIEQYIDSVLAQNSLLNNLYYKDGIRLGIKLNNEINIAN